MRRVILGAVAALGVGAAPAHANVPVTLRGSPESMTRQNQMARKAGLRFAETPAEVRALESEGELVRLEGSEDYEVANFVRHPQARPEMRTFLERFAAQYRAATGETLVVTSLIRPATRQPGNSHELSVHPAGVAVDLRVSQNPAAREWLEDTLLSLERQGLLDITRERNPPHYHVALFPEAYLAHVERLQAQEALAAREQREAHAERAPADRSSGARLLAVVALLLGMVLVLRRRLGGDPRSG